VHGTSVVVWMDDDDDDANDAQDNGADNAVKGQELAPRSP
jgi:hypothetical protein